MPDESIATALEKFWGECHTRDSYPNETLQSRYMTLYGAAHYGAVCDLWAARPQDTPFELSADERRQYSFVRAVQDPLPHAVTETAPFLLVGNGERRAMLNEMVKGQAWAEEMFFSGCPYEGGGMESPEWFAMTLMAYLSIATEESDRHFLRHLRAQRSPAEWLKSAKMVVDDIVAEAAYAASNESNSADLRAGLKPSSGGADDGTAEDGTVH